MVNQIFGSSLASNILPLVACNTPYKYLTVLYQNTRKVSSFLLQEPVLYTWLFYLQINYSFNSNFLIDI